MQINKQLLFSIFVLSFLIIYTFYDFKFYDEPVEIEKDFTETITDVNTPISIAMYDYIDKYSDKYDIPKHIAFNVAYLETKYCGPFHWRYNHKQKSSVGAVGPMQIMYDTANDIHKQKVSKIKLMTDLKFNIKTSMMLLSKKYKRYKSWALACGYYNTGRPIVNDYALYCVNNKNYQKKWLKM